MNAATPVAVKWITLTLKSVDGASFGEGSLGFAPLDDTFHPESVDAMGGMGLGLETIWAVDRRSTSDPTAKMRLSSTLSTMACL
jgi:hypothetical protein